MTGNKTMNLFVSFNFGMKCERVSMKICVRVCKVNPILLREKEREKKNDLVETFITDFNITITISMPFLTRFKNNTAGILRIYNNIQKTKKLHKKKKKEENHPS